MSKRVKKKPVDWVGSSLEDLKSFPNTVQQSFGFDLHQVQHGYMPESAKALKVKELSGVYELKSNHESNTYRTVYIAKLEDKIYVLHCFQKKSKSGIATPPKDMEIIRRRLKQVVKNSYATKKETK